MCSGVRLSRVDGGLHKPEPLPRGPPDSDLQVGGERTVFTRVSRVIGGCSNSPCFCLAPQKNSNFQKCAQVLQIITPDMS